ncbi:MAG: hypothetical protein WCQ90_06305 [Deltaproteobacteria bacterium]
MRKKETIGFLLSLPRDCRDKLRIIAAQRNLRNPGRVASASGIARDIIVDYLKEIERLEAENHG